MDIKGNADVRSVENKLSINSLTMAAVSGSRIRVQSMLVRVVLSIPFSPKRLRTISLRLNGMWSKVVGSSMILVNSSAWMGLSSPRRIGNYTLNIT